MEAREGIGQAAPDGQLPLEKDDGIPLAPGKDNLVSSGESFKPPFPPVLTYPLCQETVVR